MVKKKKKRIKEFGRVDAQNEKLEAFFFFTKEFENIKNNQTKLKNTVAEMKNK